MKNGQIFEEAGEQSIELDRVEYVLEPSGVSQPLASARCAEKSLFLGATRRFRVSKNSCTGYFQVDTNISPKYDMIKDFPKCPVGN